MCIQADPDVAAFGVDVREDEAHVPAGDLHTSVQPTDVLNGGRRWFRDAGELLFIPEEHKTVLKHVPKGLTKNMHFVVDNSDTC